jgi:hypothetical protein
MRIFLLFVSLASSVSVLAGPLDFKTMGEDDLKNICSEVCGATYTSKVELRDFFQLKKYPDLINQTGLLCSKPVEWQSTGTPCHNRKPYMGIHSNGLAPTKTEIHRGGWALQQGGAWCIAYNEDDFIGMKKAIIAGKFKPGQVACLSGMKLESIK